MGETSVDGITWTPAAGETLVEPPLRSAARDSEDLWSTS